MATPASNLTLEQLLYLLYGNGTAETSEEEDSKE